MQIVLLVLWCVYLFDSYLLQIMLLVLWCVYLSDSYLLQIMLFYDVFTCLTATCCKSCC